VHHGDSRTAAFQGNQFQVALSRFVHTSGTQNFADCISMNRKQKAPPLVPTDGRELVIRATKPRLRCALPLRRYPDHSRDHRGSNLPCRTVDPAQKLSTEPHARSHLAPYITAYEGSVGPSAPRYLPSNRSNSPDHASRAASRCERLAESDRELRLGPMGARIA
jgi:hypothetical protein